MLVASFEAELVRKEGEPGAAIGQLIERDLCSGSTDLYGVGWRDILTKSIFCFWICCCLVRCLGCLGGLVLLSPFLARQRPRCLIGGCFEAAGVVGAIGTPEGRAEVGMVEDLVVAEDPPNMRNRSSTFRHGVPAYLADRSAMVR